MSTLVDPDARYDASKTLLNNKEGELARALFTMIQAARAQISASDEDAGFDLDDAIEVVMHAAPTLVMAVVQFVRSGDDLARGLEGVSHGVARNLIQ